MNRSSRTRIYLSAHRKFISMKCAVVYAYRDYSIYPRCPRFNWVTTLPQDNRNTAVLMPRQSGSIRTTKTTYLSVPQATLTYLHLSAHYPHQSNPSVRIAVGRISVWRGADMSPWHRNPVCVFVLCVLCGPLRWFIFPRVLKGILLLTVGKYLVSQRCTVLCTAWFDRLER